METFSHLHESCYSMHCAPDVSLRNADCLRGVQVSHRGEMCVRGGAVESSRWHLAVRSSSFSRLLRLPTVSSCPARPLTVLTSRPKRIFCLCDSISGPRAQTKLGTPEALSHLRESCHCERSSSISRYAKNQDSVFILLSYSTGL